MVSHIILVMYSPPRPSLLRKEGSAHDLDSHIFKNFSDLEHGIRHNKVKDVLLNSRTLFFTISKSRCSDLPIE